MCMLRILYLICLFVGKILVLEISLTSPSYHVHEPYAGVYIELNLEVHTTNGLKLPRAAYY